MLRCLRSGVIGVLGVVLVGSLSTAAGAQSVSSTAFTRQVCAAVASASQSSRAPSATLKSAAQAFKASPSATTATALRDAFTQSAQNLDQESAVVLAAIQQAGTPAKAAVFVNAVVSELQLSRTAAQQLAQHSAAIDTTSLATFAAGFQQVVNEARADSALLHRSAKTNPAFKHVARRLRPLAHFMTTSAKTCTKT
jgi:hypothetical protein